MFFFIRKSVLVSGPPKWWRTALMVGLVLLPGLLLASVGSKKADLNKGLTAARAGDFAGAHAAWLPLARQGSAEAQYRLGLLFETVDGTQQNRLIVAQWYRQAAAQGHSGAQYKLGIMSFQGWGMPRDATKAASYFFEAANKGHARAQYSLGTLYQIGRGVPKNLREARYWFSRAKANGFVSPNKSARV